MNNRRGLIILGLLMVILSSCGIGDNSMAIDSVVFGWETTITLYRSELEETDMTLDDCTNLGNSCSVISDSCNLINPGDVGELTLIEIRESITSDTTLYNSVDPSDLPSDTKELLESAPLEEVTIVIVPDASSEDKYQLHVLAERFIDIDSCLDNDDETSIATYDKVCDIGERTNVYGLTFIPEAVLDLVCMVEVPVLTEVDVASLDYRTTDSIGWPDLEAADGQEIEREFSGWATFTSGSYTYTLRVAERAEYERLISRYRDHLQNYEMVVDRNGNEKEIVRRGQ